MRFRWSALLVALSVVGSHPLAASATPAAPAPAAPAAKPNLVLITLDTTRADHLGAWGWRWARTPNLDVLAGRGTRFVRCDAAAPITLPSHASLLTGLYPFRTGVRDNGTFVLSARVESIAQRLRSAGYDTAAVVSAVVLARRQGLDQGFRIYDDDLGTGYAAATAEGERQAEGTVDAALAVLGQLRAPYLLWVHFYDPHEEYRPPTRFADAIGGPHRLYDGEIAYMDEQIGRLIAALPPDAVVAAVGDHGEMLGEHGELSHGLLPFAAARRVPLILAGPRVPAATIEECLVRTVDLAPTLLELAGVAVPAGLDGRTLLPLPSRGGGCDRTSYGESLLPFFSYKWFPLRTLSDGAWLFLEAPRPALFALQPLPDEERDLAAQKPRDVATWRQRLVELLASGGERLDATLRAENVLSDEQRRQLASLGYLAGGSGGAVTSALPDPRRMTDIATRLHEASAAVGQGRCEEWLRPLHDIVRRDPHNYPALNLAGLCLEAAGRTADALALFQRASAENDLSAIPIANAAGALLKLGRKAEAERELRRALALDPTQPEAATNLARLLREGGKGSAAVAVLDAAVAAGGRAPAIFLERGVAHAAASRLTPARADFRAAARRAPTNPLPLANAAHAAYELGQKQAAVQMYEQLLRLAPDRLADWKTLGAIYLYDLEDAPRATEAFRRALALEADPQERAKLTALLSELGG